MVYVGSKARIADEILPIILKNRKPGQLYVEPFMGGGNVICKVKGPRWGNGINKPLITLFKAVIEGWKPPLHLTKTDYRYLRLNQNKADPVLVAYAGFMYAFRSKWFGGYEDSTTYNGAATKSKEIKRAEGRFKSFLTTVPHLKEIKLTCMHYSLMSVGDSIIYCDPPYGLGLGRYLVITRYLFLSTTHPRTLNVFGQRK